MSFDVLIQKNLSEKNAFRKEIELISTLNGTLKEGTSIVDPTIIFNGDISGYIDVNYMTISTFGRSYFITDIRSISYGIFEISGHVDVLCSFKNEILSNSAIIKKQEHKWNLYLNDGSLRTYQDVSVLTKPFPGGFATQEIVLAVAGG